MFISLILLAGGKGSRMKSPIPKQYLPLKGKPIIRHSFDVLTDLPEISEWIIVTEKEGQKYFSNIKKTQFALPGNKRQESVYQGFIKTSPQADLILIHDSARPFIEKSLVQKVIEQGMKHGSSVLATPIDTTIKEVDSDFYVIKTLERSKLWKMQTPQALKPEILKKGFKIAHQKKITVTDDVQLAELAGYPTKLVLGSEKNFKITTPLDYQIAQHVTQTL